MAGGKVLKAFKLPGLTTPESRSAIIHTPLVHRETLFAART